MLNKYKLNQTKSALNGKEINLTSENTTIKSDNFNVDRYGRMTLKSNNGAIGGTSNFNIEGTNANVTLKEYYNRVFLNNPNAKVSAGMMIGDAKSGISATIGLTGVTGSDFVSMSIEDEIGTAELSVAGGGNYTYVRPSGIKTPTLTQTSLESQKKNFEKMQDNALNIINNIDIYKYNLKSEEDTDKKHIGFVIGDNFNYSKEVTSQDNTGVDNYSFTSLCCKAIQEQQKQIEELKKEIEILKGEKNG